MMEEIPRADTQYKGKGRVLRVKEGFNPNSSSLGSIVFSVPAALLAVPVLLAGAAALIVARMPRPGQIGDLPLLALLGYGIAAILSTLPIVAACSLLEKRSARISLSFLGCIAVIVAVMGLYAVRHLYVDSQYDSNAKRFVFLVKSINNLKEVPDEMLPLYDKDFAKRIMETGEKAE